MDWEPLAASTFYLGPMYNTLMVGNEAASFIDFLVKETGLKTEDIHFIGIYLDLYMFSYGLSAFCYLLTTFCKVTPLGHM